jgi:hypothetical protein
VRVGRIGGDPFVGAQGELDPDFTTAHDFLRHVQRAYEDRWYATAMARGSDSWRHRPPGSYEDLVRLGLDPVAPVADPTMETLQATVVPEVLAILPEATRASFDERCAIGSLDHESINARCFRSANALYAIVIHHGFTIFMSKFVKMRLAYSYLDRIAYCSYTYPRTPTKDELRNWEARIFNLYLRTGHIAGPIISFDDDIIHVQAGGMMSFIDAFVLGHEIGHFACGHLDRDDAFGPDPYFPHFEVLVENQNHEDEVQADGFGFEAMAAYMRKTFKKDPDRGMVFRLLFTLFSALNLMDGNSPSATHPTALTRLCRLGERYLDTPAEVMARAIVSGDHSELAWNA